MATSALGYRNHIDTGTLTAGSALSSRPVSNLKHPLASDLYSWQTAATVRTAAGGAYFDIDAGTATDWRGFCIARTNLTGTAQVRWRVSNAADFSTTVYNSGWLIGLVDPLVGQLVHTAPSTQSGRYVRCEIDDLGQPTDGSIRVGAAFAGPLWTPTIGLYRSSGSNLEKRQDLAQTRGGQSHVDYRWSRRSWMMALREIPDSDMWSLLAELVLEGSLGRNILLIPELDGTYAQKEAVLGSLEEASSVAWYDRSMTARQWSGKIEERL